MNFTQTKTSVNNHLYSTFKMDIAIHEQQTQVPCKNVSNLLEDVFPFYSLYSVTTVLIILQILVNIFISSETLAIKPYFASSQLLPWVFCLFATPNLSYMISHIVFMMMIGSELQKKLKNSTKFLLILLVFSILGNLLAKLFFIPSGIPLITNEGTFAIYIYLHIIQVHERNSPFEFNVQEVQRDTSDEKAEGLYKCIFFSYLIYAGTYQLAGTHFSIYLCGLILATMIGFIADF